jgi:hypothetical protein
VTVTLSAIFSAFDGTERGEGGAIIIFPPRTTRDQREPLVRYAPSDFIRAMRKSLLRRSPPSWQRPICNGANNPMGADSISKVSRSDLSPWSGHLSAPSDQGKRRVGLGAHSVDRRQSRLLLRPGFTAISPEPRRMAIALRGTKATLRKAAVAWTLKLVDLASV